MSELGALEVWFAASLRLLSVCYVAFFAFCFGLFLRVLTKQRGLFYTVVQVRDMNGAAISSLLSEGANQLSKIKRLGFSTLDRDGCGLDALKLWRIWTYDNILHPCIYTFWVLFVLRLNWRHFFVVATFIALGVRNILSVVQDFYPEMIHQVGSTEAVKHVWVLLLEAFDGLELKSKSYTEVAVLNSTSSFSGKLICTWFLELGVIWTRNILRLSTRFCKWCWAAWNPRLFNFVSPLLNERMQAKIKVRATGIPFEDYSTRKSLWSCLLQACHLKDIAGLMEARAINSLVNVSCGHLSRAAHDIRRRFGCVDPKCSCPKNPYRFRLHYFCWGLGVVPHLVRN